MKNRVCLTCGERYYFCPNCDRDKNEPHWKAKFHNENCKQVFQTLLQHYLKGLNDEEARNQLLSCDLEMDHYTKDMQEQIQALLGNREEGKEG